MKKRNFVTYLGLASLVLGSLWSVPVGADGDIHGNATINFITDDTGNTGSGKTENIYIKSVPTFTFDAMKLNNAMSTLSNIATGDPIVVDNYTGDSMGYHIDAKTNGLYRQGGNKSTADKLPADIFEKVDNGSGDDATGQIKGNGSFSQINDSSATIATGNENANGEFKSGNTSLQLKNIDKNKNIKKATYKGTIDYTLIRGNLTGV